MNDLLAATPLEPTSSCSMNEAMDNSMTERVEAFYRGVTSGKFRL